MAEQPKNDFSSKIRVAQAEDAAAILAIYGPYILDTAISFEYEVPGVNSFTARMEAVLPKFPWLVYEVGGGVVGYAYAGPHKERTAYQWSVESSVYIHRDYHHRGIGKRLYQALLAILQLQGYINLYAGITLPNPKSEQFHSKFGFQPVGVYRNVGFKFGQWHDVGWFALNLADYPAMPVNPVPFNKLAGTEEVGRILSYGVDT